MGFNLSIDLFYRKIVSDDSADAHGLGQQEAVFLYWKYFHMFCPRKTGDIIYCERI